MRRKQAFKGDMMFSYKIFKQGDDILLAISDSNIIGKTLREKELEIRVNEDFYSEKICDGEKAVELINDATIVNAIGEYIIDLMVKEKLIEKENILKIGGVPHAQIIKIK
jgi:hypothetical protein